MVEHSDPIRMLLTARDRLVEERRALIVAIGLGYSRRRTDDPQTNEMRQTLISLQDAIEAVGRAIEDERSAASRPIRESTPSGWNSIDTYEGESAIAAE
jgi:hypothetical protein